MFSCKRNVMKSKKEGYVHQIAANQMKLASFNCRCYLRYFRNDYFLVAGIPICLIFHYCDCECVYISFLFSLFSIYQIKIIYLLLTFWFHYFVLRGEYNFVFELTFMPHVEICYFRKVHWLYVQKKVGGNFRMILSF